MNFTLPTSYSGVFALASQVADEIAEGANTAERVGGFMKAIVKMATMPYDAGGGYVMGQYVYYNDAVYRAKESVDIGESPSAMPIKWKPIGGTDDLQKVTERGAKTTATIVVNGIRKPNSQMNDVANVDWLAGFVNHPTDTESSLEAISIVRIGELLNIGQGGTTPTDGVVGYQVNGPTQIQEGSNTNTTFLLQEILAGNQTRTYSGPVTWSLLYKPHPSISINASTGAVTVPIGTVNPNDYITVRASFGAGKTSDKPATLIQIDTSIDPASVDDLYEFIPDQDLITIRSLRIDGTPSLNEGGAAGTYSVTALLSNNTETPYTGAGSFAWVGAYPNGMGITVTGTNTMSTRCLANTIQSDVTLTLKYTPTDTGINPVTRPVPVKDTVGTQPTPTITDYRIDGIDTLIEGGSVGNYKVTQIYSDLTESPYGGESASANPWSLKIPYPNGMVISKTGSATASTLIPTNSIQANGNLTIQYALPTGRILTKIVAMVNAAEPNLTVTSVVLSAPTSQDEGTSSFLSAVANYSNGAAQTDPTKFEWAIAAATGNFTVSTIGAVAQLLDCILGVNGLFTAFNNSTPNDNRDVRIRATFGGQSDIKTIHIVDKTPTSNRAPVLNTPLQFTFARQGVAFDYPINPSGHFTDPDGDALTGSIQISNDNGTTYTSTLPSWISYANSRYTGTPPVTSGNNVTYKLRRIVTDPGNLSAKDDFNFIAQPQN